MYMISLHDNRTESISGRFRTVLLTISLDIYSFHNGVSETLVQSSEEDNDK
jgi:hypothetical protein